MLLLQLIELLKILIKLILICYDFIMQHKLV
jgi:hypothetical protein